MFKFFIMYVTISSLFFLHLICGANDQCDTEEQSCSGTPSVSTSPGWNGNPRLVLDNVIDQETCDALIDISSKYGVVGGNYQQEQQGKHGAPYNHAEFYTGINTYRMKANGFTEVHVIDEVAADVKALVKVFMKRRNIQFDLIDLVCRQSVEGEVHGDRFSIGLHADYCAIESDGTCTVFSEKLAERTTAAFLYLTEVENGGELLIANRPNTDISREIKPRCGRLVALDSGEYKAINAVKQGKRCELAIWFKNAHPRASPPVPQTITSRVSPGWNGTPRLVEQNFIEEITCETMKKVVDVYGTKGSGYRPNQQKRHGSPYTNSESFIAVSLDELIKTKKGVSKATITMIRYVAEAVLTHASTELKRDLILAEMIHLFCRAPVEGEPREDGISHNLHSDNCYLNFTSGRCDPHEVGSFLYNRVLSALVYLSTDYEGGEFFFANRPNTEIVQTVKPKCGTMVAFDSGEYHGVKAVTKGQRCSMAVWCNRGKDPDQKTHTSDLSRITTGWNGNSRLAQDSVIDNTACSVFMELATKLKIADGSMSVLTLDEDAMEKNSLIEPAEMISVQLISKKIRKEVEAQLNRPNLDIKSVHIVRKMSSPIDERSATDSCKINFETGDCIDDSSELNYISAISVLYLNGEGEGGEVIFLDQGKKEATQTDKAQCGRLLAFDAGENYSFSAVEKGMRFALVITFQNKTPLS